MTLSFTQTINGKPNYFIEKIWKSIILYGLSPEKGFIKFCYNPYFEKFGENVPRRGILIAKIHTIRHPRRSKNGEKAVKQWKSGDKIHPAINNRSPNYFQFAPVLPCISVQRIDIDFINSSYTNPTISIDGKCYYADGAGYDKFLRSLAFNDGFDTVKSFLEYFQDGVTDGSLIHWTPLKY